VNGMGPYLTFSDSHTREAPEVISRWDEASSVDEARIHFVVPQAMAMIRRLQPVRVVDIGPKSGYLIRALLQQTRRLSESTFYLVERDRTASEYLKETLAEHRNVKIINADVNEWPDLPAANASTLYILSYTFLELSDSTLLSVFRRPSSGDVLAVFTPDVTEDLQSQAEWHQYLVNGTAVLDKCDKFTGEPCLFIARRPEHWVGQALSQGLAMTSLSTYSTRESKKHLLFEFLSTSQP
jgi:hypothetical protein